MARLRPDLRPGLRRAGENGARQAIQGRGCAVDLSSLHLLGLLAGDDQLLIRSALPDMTTARSAVSDPTLIAIMGFRRVRLADLRVWSRVG